MKYGQDVIIQKWTGYSYMIGLLGCMLVTPRLLAFQYI